MALTRLMEVKRCRPGAGTFIERGGRELAVFLLSDPERVFVIDNACPHSGGNLAGGDVNEDVVTCPWHQWAFALETGVCTLSAHARVTRYRAEVRDGAVWVELPPAPSTSSGHTPGTCRSS